MLVEHREIRHFHLFAGCGGGALGFQRAQARVGNLLARMRCLGGIDVDGSACRDFEALTGTPATCLDLFDAQQYEDFHGRPPPTSWREATPADIRRAAGGEEPNIVFLSPPCKGFSGLLSQKASASRKYQALNALTVRGVWLVLEAFRPELFLLENVPRIQTRGRALLDQIRALLESYGYAVAETVHDCGEIGGLGQHRRRFLLVARHRTTVPPFLYEPPLRRVRSVGEVLGEMPLPDDPAGGPMHVSPRLTWETLIRLAMIPAGGDWRSLQDLPVVQHQGLDGVLTPGVLAQYALVPGTAWHHGTLGVQPWGEPAGAVTSGGGPSTGRFSVADPRVARDWRRDSLGVRRWGDSSGAVTSAEGPTTGAFSVADPRMGAYGEHYGKMRVEAWGEASHTVTTSDRVGSGALSIADPRQGWQAGKNAHYNLYRLIRWTCPAVTVVGATRPAGGGLSVADPRRPGCWGDYQAYRVKAWDESAGTITAKAAPGGGGFSIADPRCGSGWGGKGKYIPVPWNEPTNAVIAANGTGQGAMAVADPRPRTWREGRPHFEHGPYGVISWDAASGCVVGKAKLDRGRWSVADPRTLPEPGERLDPPPVIIALDGTWHRPFTTLELAALQGFPVLPGEGEALVFDGRSHSGWRERIGNAVPPPAAEAIASTMAQTLLLAWAGQTFIFGSTPIWVDPALALALAVEVPCV